MFGPIFLIIASAGWERSHWHFLYYGSQNFQDISRKCEAYCNDVSIVFVQPLVPGLVWQQTYQLWAARLPHSVTAEQTAAATIIIKHTSGGISIWIFISGIGIPQSDCSTWQLSCRQPSWLTDRIKTLAFSFWGFVGIRLWPTLSIEIYIIIFSIFHCFRSRNVQQLYMYVCRFIS